MIVNIISSYLLILTSYYLFSVMNKEVKIEKHHLIIIFLISLLLHFNYEYVNGFLRMITAFIIISVTYKSIFKLSTYKAALETLIYYIIVSISEIIFVLFLLTILKVDPNSFLETIIGTYISNISISVIITLIIGTFKKHLKNIGFYIEEKEEKLFLFISAIAITILGMIFFKNYYNSFTINIEFFINFITIIFICMLIINLLLDKTKLNAIDKEYKITKKYLSTMESMINKYQKERHEYHNNLIVLKSLKPNERNDFIKKIMRDDEIKEIEWINNLTKFPDGGIKGILFHKLINQNDIKISLNVSKKINKAKLSKETKFDISKVLGIVLDNAIEGALETKDKFIVIDYYNEDKNFIISVSNSLKSKKVAINTEFSTKKNHKGIGLKLLKEITNNSTKIEIETIVEDKIFTQKIKIKE